MAPVKESKWEEIYQKLTILLQDPFMLRVVVLSILVIFGLGGVGVPLLEEDKGLREEFVQEKKRQELIGDYHSLDLYMKRYKKRIPKNADLDWWIAYLLKVSRETNIQIIEYKPFVVKGMQAKVGSLQGVLLVFRLTGHFDDILKFVGTLENRPDIMRVASIVLLPGSPIGFRVSLAVLTSKTKVGVAESGGVGGEPAAEKENDSGSEAPAVSKNRAVPSSRLRPNLPPSKATSLPVGPQGAALKGGPSVHPMENVIAAPEGKTEE
jgi:hypothetical protein